MNAIVKVENVGMSFDTKKGRFVALQDVDYVAQIEHRLGVDEDAILDGDGRTFAAVRTERLAESTAEPETFPEPAA